MKTIVGHKETHFYDKIKIFLNIVCASIMINLKRVNFNPDFYVLLVSKVVYKMRRWVGLYSFGLITTLTNVLMNKFCPCFIFILKFLLALEIRPLFFIGSRLRLPLKKARFPSLVLTVHCIFKGNSQSLFCYQSSYIIKFLKF